MTAGDNLPSPDALRSQARAVLVSNWRPEGYTVPNATTYPFQWLWDSCFHAIAWVELGEPDRARLELAHLFRTQDDLGFVPHIDYELEPDHLASFWGRRGSSSISQPPMYGHAVAELVRRGVEVDDDLIERAGRGLRFFLHHRARDPDSGLITIVHPWESGADDSPRWDHWCPGGWEPLRWREVKGTLLDTVVRSAGGAPLANPAFGAAPVGFNALVAFNAMELASVSGDRALRSAGDELAALVADRWLGQTWVDAGPASASSGRIRTLDALLPALTGGSAAPVALRLAVDPGCYGGRCGPAGVHRDEPSFSARSYWRGAAWPQLTYLLWVSALRSSPRTASELAAMLVRGAMASGFAEYWDPDDGTGLGAIPQSWTALAAVVAGQATTGIRTG